MAVVRTGIDNMPRSSRLSRIDNFIPPNLLLGALLAFMPFSPQEQTDLHANTPHARQQVREDYARPLTLFAQQAAAESNPRTAIVQPSSLRQRPPLWHAPPNLLVSTLGAAPVQPPFKPLGISQSPRAVRRAIEETPQRSIVLDLSVTPPVSNPRAPILQAVARRQRRNERQIYYRPAGLAPAAAAAPFVPYNDAPEMRKGRARAVHYSVNLSLGQDMFFTDAGRGPFNYDWTIPRSARPNPPIPLLPNLLTSTLAPPPAPPFKPLLTEQQTATRRRQPLPVEPVSLNMSLRGGGIMPFTPNLAEQQTATRRRYPLPVESYPLNFSTYFSQFFPKIQSFSERIQTRARPSQEANTFLQPLVLNLLGKDARCPFTYDFTIQRKARPNPEEPVFRNVLTTQPAAPVPFTPVDWALTRGLRPNPQEPIFRNFAVLQAPPVQPPFVPADWTITRGSRPNPQEPVFRNFLTTVAAPIPFIPSDWLSIRRNRFSPQEPVFRDFLTTATIQAPFIPIDFPSPPRHSAIDRPTLDINRLPLQAAIKPFGSGDWPNAPRARQSVSRYTFLHPLQFWLIGKDVFFYGPGRGPFNYDWKIPFRRVSIERETIMDLGRTPLVSLNFAPTIPGIEYVTSWELLEYRSKVDRLHYLSLADRVHYRVIEEDS